MKKRIMIPPRMGGGDVVMREMTCGEYEEQLLATADAKWTERVYEQVCGAIVTFRGKPLPAGEAREAWWRALSLPLRQFLVGVHARLNSTADKEIEDFFEAAESA